MKRLNEGITCYLSPKAEELVKSLVHSYNMDLDLAVEVTNLLMQAEEMWELPPDDKDDYGY